MERRWSSVLPPAVALATVLAAGCTVTPGPPPVSLTRQTLPVANDVARTRMLDVLARQGFTVTEAAPGGIMAERRDVLAQAWVDCPLRLVRDEQSDFVRSDWTEPRGAAVVLRIGLQPAAAGTAVLIAAEPRGTYVDRYRNIAFTAPCRSTGAVEQALLSAAAGG